MNTRFLEFVRSSMSADAWGRIYVLQHCKVWSGRWTSGFCCYSTLYQAWRK